MNNEQKINYWEIGTAIEEAGKALKNTPLSIIKSATEDEEREYNNLLSRVKQHQKNVQDAIEKLHSLDQEHVEACDRISEKMKIRNKAMIETIRELDIPDTYKMERLVSLFDQFKSLDEIAFSRLLDFVRALK